MISELVVHSVQTVHLSCTHTNTVSKWIENSFHMTQIITEFHRAHPKQFLSLWYVWRKSCTYLALTQTMSPNRPKWDCTWLTWYSSSIGCVQNDFWACATFGTHHAPNRPKWGSTWPTSPRSSIGCIQNDFWAYGTFGAKRAPILRQDYHYLQTDQRWHCLQMDRNKIPHDPRHLAVSSCVSKMISQPMVRSAQIVRLSCTHTNTISKWTETRFYMTQIIKEFHWAHLKWYLSLWYVWRKSCTYLAPTQKCLQTDQYEIAHDSRHVAAPSGVFKMISKPVLHLAQTVHLSCTNTNTATKQTKTRFHMTHVT
jgi:hypothetical protein